MTADELKNFLHAKLIAPNLEIRVDDLDQEVNNPLCEFRNAYMVVLFWGNFGYRKLISKTLIEQADELLLIYIAAGINR